MKKYLLIKASEDGEPCTFLDDLAELLENPVENYGVERFFDAIPEKSPMYWNDRDALLLKIEVLRPRVRATAFTLDG